jgi:hypothetical protein
MMAFYPPEVTMQQRIIWQTPTGEVYIGFIAAGRYAVPVKGFKTRAELICYIESIQQELVMCYDFVEHILSERINNRSTIIDYVNSLEQIDKIKQL